MVLCCLVKIIALFLNSQNNYLSLYSPLLSRQKSDSKGNKLFSKVKCVYFENYLLQKYF